MESTQKNSYTGLMKNEQKGKVENIKESRVYKTHVK